MSLYAILLICSIAVPLVLSFDKKLQFYKRWNIIMPAIVIVAAIYIAFDIYLTKLGVWGFNPRYHSTILLFNLPIEEWLFFIVIPYASIFLHESFCLYFPSIRLKDNISKLFTIILIVFISIVLVLNFNKIYTVYIFSFLVLSLILSLFDKSRIINRFFVTFLLILIPFLIVNAILTGSFINGEVVWYNNAENLGIRIGTIPVEDFGYAFSLILFNLLLISKFINVLSIRKIV
jgi:lycopene cyclase domain-containing protein